MEDDLSYADVFTLQRERVPAELLVNLLLERIAVLDSPAPGPHKALRSVLAVSEIARDEARAQDEARARDEAGPLGDRTPSGPLQGVPVLVKDNIEVAGLPSTAGATSLVGRPPTADAPLIKRVREAGAIILGTTNLSEWANIRSTRSTSGWSAVGGLTGNPWALDRSAGGSSSGAGAALAAGFAPLAIGTETDGSITCPASLNGIAGIKPTVGSLPMQGVVPISFSQDNAGPMARTVDEVALFLEVLTAKAGILDRAGPRGPAHRRRPDISHRPPGPDELFDETVGKLAATGATLLDVAPPVQTAAESDDEDVVLLCELFDGLAAYLPTRGPGGPQDLAQVIEFENQNAATELAYFGHDMFERAVALGGCDTEAYRAARARNLAWALGTCLQPATANADVLVGPTYSPAWKSDLALSGDPRTSSGITSAAAIAGWPIATAPMGLVEGLPVGFGAVGRPGSEALLLAVCRAVEQPARPSWRPPCRG